MTSYELNAPRLFAALRAYQEAHEAEVQACINYLNAVRSGDRDRWVACARMVLNSNRCAMASARVLDEEIASANRLYGEELERSMGMLSVEAHAQEIRLSLPIPALAR